MLRGMLLKIHALVRVIVLEYLDLNFVMKFFFAFQYIPQSNPCCRPVRCSIEMLARQCVQCIKRSCYTKCGHIRSWLVDTQVIAFYSSIDTHSVGFDWG